MDKIYAHIVGINNKDKKKFIKDIKTLNYNVLDLNYITKKVKNDEFYKQISQYLENSRSKFEKNAISHCMHTYWKTKINKNLSKMNDNKIIILGLDKLNETTKLDMEPKNKFFLKHNLENNAKEVIEDNLTKYHNKILEGSFSLDYLDKDYIIQRRKKIMDEYKKDNYKLITYDNLINFLKDDTNIKQIQENTHLSNIFYTTKIKHHKKIGVGLKGGKKDALDMLIEENKGNKENNEIYGYTQKWLALLSFIPEHQKYFEKSLHDNKPCIEILNKKGKELLNQTCYLYELNPNTFVKASSKNPYKYKANAANILHEWDISNIGEELKKCNVKIVG